VNETEIDDAIETTKKMVRFDEAVIKGLIKEASLAGVAPEHRIESFGQERFSQNTTFSRSRHKKGTFSAAS
jgi:hypothetical protein